MRCGWRNFEIPSQRDERIGRVIESIGHGQLQSAEQCLEGFITEPPAADRQHVDKVADGSLEPFLKTTTFGHADDYVVLTAIAVEQCGKQTEKERGERYLSLTGKVADP